MCEFISWVTKKGQVVFLTGDDVFESKRGKELQEYSADPDDWIGHGAIKWYYNFKGGRNKECTDFSSPANFPTEIADAIKAGKMRGLGTSEQLLTQAAWVEYEKIEQQTLAECEKIEQQALAEYDKIEQQALAEYDKIEQQALAKYRKITQPAWAKYEKITQQAWAKYEKITQQAFWGLFAVQKNRAKCWR